MTRSATTLLLAVTLALTFGANGRGADLVWTGAGDGVSLFSEANWRDETTGRAPPAGTVDPNRDIDRDLVIDRARRVVGGGGGVGPGLQLGTGSLTVSRSVLNLRVSARSSIDLGTSDRRFVVEDATVYAWDIRDAAIEVRGTSSVYLSGQDGVAGSTTVDLASDDSWLHFLSVRPRAVDRSHLTRVRVRGTAAVHGENVVVSIYGHGTAVRAKPAYPLAVWEEPDRRGTRLDLSAGYLKGDDLEPLENRIRSFVLKKGYMATVSANRDGTGASQVFIASDQDLVVDSLPAGLRNTVSAIRVARWLHAPKKGVCNVNNPDFRSALDATWYYEWEIRGWSNLDEHFVPMMKGSRAYEWDPGDDRWNDVRWGGGTSFLYLNEPDSENQGDTTVAEAVAHYEEILKLGLRVGSPACTDNAAGRAWLDAFMTEINRRGHRIDFIALHYYQKNSANHLRSRLQSIHDAYGLPIWVTEFNYGGSWSGSVTESQTRTAIEAFCLAMDELDFVERYSIFSFSPGTNRSLFSSRDPFVVNSIGRWYRDHEAPLDHGEYAPVAEASELVAGEDVLVPPGATWAYLDEGPSPLSDWHDAAFSDADWDRGVAPFGYGDGDETTVVEFGGNPDRRRITTHFRHAFTVADPDAISALSLSLLRDDGALVRLNGTEVLRSNLPPGEVGPNTLAVEPVGGALERSWEAADVDPCLLVAGVNMLAVEVHQATRSSSDLSFDLSLRATLDGPGGSSCGARFRRADSNGDGSVNIADAVASLEVLFGGGLEFGCDDAADANDDGTVNISDAIATLGVLFLSRGEIPAPGMNDCGVDPSDDPLDCRVDESCS